MGFRKDVIIYKGKNSTVYINQCYNRGRITNAYAIRKDSSFGLGDMLGEIKWHGAWRQYVFFPSENTMWNSTCLENIQKFLKEINTMHWENKK